MEPSDNPRPAEPALPARPQSSSQPSWQRRVHVSLSRVATHVAVILLVVLGLRAVLRLDTWWDSWLYHIPFAARYGGLGIPYTSRPEIQAVLEGFPPLPFVVHGLLWRLTGSLHAIGARNWLAFLLFLYFAHRELRARAATVTVVALTAPLVLIHLSTTYYDLFAGAFLAIAVSGCVSALLFERWNEQRLLLWILAGLVLASWSKYVMVPFVALLLLFLLGRYAFGRAPQRRRFLLFVWSAALISALPYLKNLVVYHNPFWPYPVPYFSGLFAHGTGWSWNDVKPPALTNRSQSELFFRSILEIGHPTSFPHRQRWTIDQGATNSAAYRSGGFWAPAAVAYCLGMFGLVGLLSRRKAGWLLLAVLALIGVCSVLPYSHQLRYLLFLPLTWAAVIGSLERYFAERRPLLMSGVLATSLALLGCMAWENGYHLRVGRVGYADVARQWRQIGWWEALEVDAVYCTVRQPQPSTFLLTGPTSREFTIHERGSREECQPNESILDWSPAAAVPSEVAARVQELVARGLELVSAKGFEAAIPLFRDAVRLNPEHHGARWQLANALEYAGHSQEALRAWKSTVALELLRGYEDANSEHARARIRALSGSLAPTHGPAHRDE